MSRSYKKTPWATDHKRRWTKESKRIANRRVRRRLRHDEDTYTLGRIQHKKYTPSWDICDYKSFMTKESAIKWYEEHRPTWYFRKHFPTLESWLNYWEKCYRRK